MQTTQGDNMYSGPTMVTADNFESLTTADILWGIHLLPISDHDQKMIAVKTAVHAAELVAHLTDDPHAVRCLEATQAWVDNPCEETRQDAEARAAWAERAAWAAREAAAAAWAVAAAERATDPTTTPKIKAHLIQLIRDQP